MAYQINKAEHAALYGLPHLQQLLYLRAIRPYMDYATGVVGIKRGISYQSLAEECYIEPHQGYASHRLSRDQIRRAVAGLERAGIIKIASKAKKLILNCLLAATDNCIQNKATTKQPQKATRIRRPQHIENSIIELASYTKATSESNDKAATPPVSGINTTLSKQAVEAKMIDADFQPNVDLVAQALRSGCHTATCPDELLRFISYHQSKGTASCNWDAEYMSWLLKGKAYNLKEKKYANSSTGNNRSSKQSAVDRVFRANQDWL